MEELFSEKKAVHIHGWACFSEPPARGGRKLGYIGGPVVETHYGKPVSYGIRRFEFDDYLLKRCGATILEPAPIERRAATSYRPD
jgi:hypothetical protein